MDQVVLTYFPSSKGKEQAHVGHVVCLCVHQFTTSEPVFTKSGTNGTPPHNSSVVLVISPTISNNNIAKARSCGTLTTLTLY